MDIAAVMAEKCGTVDLGRHQERAAKNEKFAAKGQEMAGIQCNCQRHFCKVDVCRQEGLNSVCVVEGQCVTM